MKEETQGFPAYKRNDVVQVISGKFKGKSGKILRLVRKKNAVIVEKVNLVKRHTKPSQLVEVMNWLDVADVEVKNLKRLQVSRRGQKR